MIPGLETSNGKAQASNLKPPTSLMQMLATATKQPLGQLLLNRGFVQPEQLDRALGEQRRGNHQKLIGEVLVEMKCCTEEHICQALALAYDLPFARLTPKII